MSTYVLGLDLGQAQDYTALAVVERLDAPRAEPAFHLRHLERFALRTLYPAVVARVASIMAREPLKGWASLVVDATGVGRPVLDLLGAAGLSPIPVTITGGDAVSGDHHDGWRVPKRDLVGVMQVLLQTGRLKIAADLPDAEILLAEMLAFRVTIDPRTAHDSYGAWREGAHDDLVLAVALACWYGTTHGALPHHCIIYRGVVREL